MKVYAVSFQPFEERASVGGFDWFWSLQHAQDAFDKEIRPETNGKTHRVRLVEYEIDEATLSGSDAITERIGDDYELLEETAPAIREHFPPKNEETKP